MFHKILLSKHPHFVKYMKGKNAWWMNLHDFPDFFPHYQNIGIFGSELNVSTVVGGLLCNGVDIYVFFLVFFTIGISVQSLGWL